MTTAFPRRFVIAAPPSGTAWIVEALNRAFRCPSDRPVVLDRLLERASSKR